jgi:hypothetical protein
MVSLLFSRLGLIVQTMLGHRSVAITLNIDRHISLGHKKKLHRDCMQPCEESNDL